MKRKIYKFLSGAKHGLFALAMVASGTVLSQQTYTLSYTGSVQSLTLPVGNWGIECWGANGGSITTLGGQGMGGYSRGEFQITNLTTTLNVFVGGKGLPATGSSSSAGAGGWNGGGGGAAVGRSGAGGGGATDVRVGGLAATDRIIVAGAGGGAAYYGTGLISASVAPGGHGGDIVAQGGARITSAGLVTAGAGGAGASGASPGVGTFILSNGLATGAGGGGFSGGSIGQQGTSGGAGGAAGPAGSGSTGGTAGGGAGYAGGAGGVQSGNQGVAGGGGSSYLGGVTSGTTIMFGAPGYITSPEILGHGIVVITELCSVQAYAVSGPDSLSPAICPGESIMLTTNAVGNYSWSTGQTSNTIIVAPATSTVYSISGTGSLICTAVGDISVTVNYGPAMNVSASNTLVCDGESVTLTATGAGAYQWAGGPAASQYVILPNVSGVYLVNGTHTLNSCTSDSAIYVGVVIPNVIMPGDAAVCAGRSVTLSASGADLYIWSGIPTGPNGDFVLQPVATVTMSLVAITQSLTASCPVTGTFVVTMRPLPTLSATAANSAACTNEPNILSVTGAQTFTWSGGGFGSVLTVSPSISTIYTVTGTDANGCVGSTMVYAMVSSCTGIETLSAANEQFDVYPNPNEGRFILKAGASMDLMLLNQVGQQVQTAELNELNGYSQEISGLTPGIYFVVPTNAGTGTVRKIIVQ